MEEHLEALFENGSHTYTTSHGSHPFVVTLRLGTVEQCYNHVCTRDKVEEAVDDMFDRHLVDERCRSFTLCIYENLPLLEIPLAQLPVFQLIPILVEVQALPNGSNTAPGNITVKFEDFEG